MNHNLPVGLRIAEEVTPNGNLEITAERLKNAIEQSAKHFVDNYVNNEGEQRVSSIIVPISGGLIFYRAIEKYLVESCSGRQINVYFAYKTGRFITKAYNSPLSPPIPEYAFRSLVGSFAELQEDFFSGSVVIADDMVDHCGAAVSIGSSISTREENSTLEEGPFPAPTVMVPTTKDVPKDESPLHYFITIIDNPFNIKYINKWILSGGGLDGGVINQNLLEKIFPEKSKEEIAEYLAEISMLERLCSIPLIRGEFNPTTMEEVESYKAFLLANCTLGSTMEEIMANLNAQILKLLNNDSTVQQGIELLIREG